MMKMEYFDKIYIKSQINYFNVCVLDIDKYNNIKNQLFKQGQYSELENLILAIFKQVNSPNKLGNDLENTFLKDCRIGFELLTDLREQFKISFETYKFINPLKLIETIEKQGDDLFNSIESDKTNNSYVISTMERALNVLREIVSIYVKIFNYFATDYPDKIQIPDYETIDYLLAIDNDVDFDLLLIGFAKTKNEIIRKFLNNFANDDEYNVRKLAENLLQNFYSNGSSILPNTTDKIQLKDTVRELIADDNLDKALDLLYDNIKSIDNIEIYNGVTMQKGMLKNIRKNQNLGLISYVDSLPLIAKINYSTLNLLSDIN